MEETFDRLDWSEGSLLELICVLISEIYAVSIDLLFNRLSLYLAILRFQYPYTLPKFDVSTRIIAWFCWHAVRWPG